MKKLFIICLLISSNLILSETERVNLAFKDINRHYLVYEPSSNINDPKKIVIGLHGYTESASGFEIETTGGINTMAEKYNFVAVIPQVSYSYEKNYFM